MLKSKELLIVGGVPKAGTTSLFRYLSSSNAVNPSRVKELKLLSSDRFDVDDYWAAFSSGGKGSHFLESTPNYILFPDYVLKNIRTLEVTSKFVFILRDPVELFFSYFKHVRNKTNLFPSNVTFSEFVKSVVLDEGAVFSSEADRNVCLRQLKSGLCSNELDRFFESPDVEVLVVFFEDLLERPGELLRGVCSFAGIDSSFLSNVTFTVENKNRVYKSVAVHKIVHKVIMLFEPIFNKFPALRSFSRSFYVKINASAREDSMDAETRVFLRGVFKDDVMKMKMLLLNNGVDGLPGWLYGR